MIETRAPGKLFLAGEYAVVEPGEPALLVGVDRYLTVRLHEGEPPNEAELTPHVRAAIRAVHELCAERAIPERQFALETSSELEDEAGHKFGLGSSAAVTVGVVDALNQFYGLGLDQYERFRLALLATIEVSPRASGGDLAASTFGGWLFYRSPDRSALAAERVSRGVSETLHSDLWERSTIAPIDAPHSLTLHVGWTGSPASTEHLVRKASNRPIGAELLERSRDIVSALGSGLVGNPAAAQAAVREARTLLRGFGEDRGVDIETPLLRALCDTAETFGAAAKPSGAGGGDCGIALAGSDCDEDGMLHAWQERGIRPLGLKVTDPLCPTSDRRLQ